MPVLLAALLGLVVQPIYVVVSSERFLDDASSSFGKVQESWQRKGSDEAVSILQKEHFETVEMPDSSGKPVVLTFRRRDVGLEQIEAKAKLLDALLKRSSPGDFLKPDEAPAALKDVIENVLRQRATPDSKFFVIPGMETTITASGKDERSFSVHERRGSLLTAYDQKDLQWTFSRAKPLRDQGFLETIPEFGSWSGAMGRSVPGKERTLSQRR